MALVGAPIKLGAFPSVDQIAGSVGSARMIRELNDETGASQYFGSSLDRFAESNRMWTEKFVLPWHNQMQQMAAVQKTLTRPDRIMALTSLDDFRHIPPVMQLPLLLHAPVLSLLKQGRIEGFGYRYEDLKDVEDVYGRLINNGVCECVQDALQQREDGEYFIETEEIICDDDPEFSDEELENIRRTRQFVIEHILRDTALDPTDIESERG